MKEREKWKKAIVYLTPQARPMPRWCLSNDCFGQATSTASVVENNITW